MRDYEDILNKAFADYADVVGALNDMLVANPGMAEQFLISYARELKETVKNFSDDGDWAAADEVQDDLDAIIVQLQLVHRGIHKVEAIRGQDPEEVGKQFRDFDEALDFAKITWRDRQR